ncbi:aldo/keto reductase [Halobellus captivus]|uniref:aldo/keto reductase n=1 Tax=Halobellus captivus TaxID=2592614 RepID=UPI00119CDE85|nr:aldo/keto reductase [Halobellus captivus]
MTRRNASGTFDIGGELTVHRLGFGALRLTGDNVLGEPENVENAKRVLQTAVSLGIDFIDTADSYGPGVSERLIRETLSPYADDVVIATKGGLLRNREGEWLKRGDPDSLRNALLCSLDRLGVDCIDLYQYHRPDPEVDFETSVTALAELKDDGVIEHIGLSNVSVDQLEAAREIADIATVQNQYNLTVRDSADVLDVCESADIGFIPYFPLGAGDLGEKSSVLAEIAESHDASEYQVALAWLLQRSPVVLPIPGTSSIPHLKENVAASHLELSDAEMRRLTE